MKKLLVFLSAFIIGASVVQAAAVNWSISDSNHKGETLYLYNGDLSSAIAQWQDGTTYTEGETSAVTEALGGSIASKSLTARGGSGTLTADSISSTITAIIYSDVSDGSDFYWTTFSTDGLVYTPPAQATGTATAGTLTKGTFSFATPSQPDDPGGDDIVPEPTTVALLALGLAAFGLKRKIA